MKIFEALLSSSGAPRIRELLGFSSERVYTEISYVRVQSVVQEGRVCEALICIAKFVDGSLAERAVEVFVRFSGVTYVDWHSPFHDEQPSLTPAQDHIEYDLDQFRVVAAQLEVLRVEPYELGASVRALLKPNQSPEPTR